MFSSLLMQVRNVLLMQITFRCLFTNGIMIIRKRVPETAEHIYPPIHKSSPPVVGGFHLTKKKRWVWKLEQMSWLGLACERHLLRGNSTQNSFVLTYPACFVSHYYNYYIIIIGQTNRGGVGQMDKVWYLFCGTDELRERKKK